METITFCNTVKTSPEHYKKIKIGELQGIIENGILQVGYEVITADHEKVRPYFDLDVKVTKTTGTPESYLSAVIQFLDKHFDSACYAISESNRATKISYHIIISNYLTSIKDLKLLGELPEFKKLGLDSSVYRVDNSKFRLLGTMGEKKDSVIKHIVSDSIEGHELSDVFENHLVTYINSKIEHYKFKGDDIKVNKAINILHMQILKEETSSNDGEVDRFIKIIKVGQLESSAVDQDRLVPEKY